MIDGCLIVSSSTWVKLEYEIGSYNQFRIEIAFFRGVDEGEGSYFVIDNIQVWMTDLLFHAACF